MESRVRFCMSNYMKEDCFSSINTWNAEYWKKALRAPKVLSEKNEIKSILLDLMLSDDDRSEKNVALITQDQVRIFEALTSYLHLFVISTSIEPTNFSETLATIMEYRNYSTLTFILLRITGKVGSASLMRYQTPIVNYINSIFKTYSIGKIFRKISSY